MLGFLFRGLTAGPRRGEAMFDAVSRIARRPHWFIEGQVPDTIDGRFAVLATATALTIVRLEQLGENGIAASASLTERFIAVMEAEHREIGLGDPTLGKTVRKLVASLARRTELWRRAVTGLADWAETTRNSLYKNHAAVDAVAHSTEALKGYWKILSQQPLEALIEGRIA